MKKETLIVIALLVAILGCILLTMHKLDKQSCLESATSLYLKEMNYQKSLVGRDLRPEEVSNINQHYNDYRSACTR